MLFSPYSYNQECIKRVSYSLYYCVVEGHHRYNHIPVSQFTQGIPAHSHVTSHRHEYDYIGHNPEQELQHSSIVSKILSLTYSTLLL